MKTRIEKDTMGEMQVPESALYGASTQRAVLNFPISGLRFGRRFIQAVGIIKGAAAKVNGELGLVPADKVRAIVQAAAEVAAGKYDEHFPLDIFQTGSGTSTNMNANEVIANVAISILGGKFGDRTLVHPNDHVNASQSSNDVIPTAMHLAAALSIKADLVPGLQELHSALLAKAKEYAEILKSGRTHLQDATPMTLGQEFGGYAAQIEYSLERLRRAHESLKELALGGTAVGTGLNTHPDFAARAIAEISRSTDIKFCEARNHFEAQAAKDALVELSGQLKTIACSCMKVANDLRWLSSGPRCGIFEITLPEIQPGSSIMPAKVNPVLCESFMMVCAQVVGNDAAVAAAAMQSNFELNVMMPVMAHNILQAIELLGSSARNFAAQCVVGIGVNREICEANAEKSLATCTSLAPVIGYDLAAKVAKHAYSKNITVRAAALELKVLPEEKLNKALDLMAMTTAG